MRRRDRPRYDRRHAAPSDRSAAGADRPRSSSPSARSRARSRAWAPCSTPRSAATSWSGCSGATVAAALATPGVTEVVVVSPDPEVLAVAEAAGARGRRPAVARPQPGDPGGARRRRRRPPADHPRRPARGHAGRPRRGPGRRRRARAARASSSRPTATAAGRTPCCSTRPTSSTPRSAATAGPATPGSRRRPTPRSSRSPDVLAPRHRHARRPAARRGGGAEAIGGDPCRLSRPRAGVEIIALAGLPEVREGDDLEAMIGDALEATTGALPAPGRRRARRHPEGRVQGRGRGRGPADGRAPPGGRRLGRGLGPRRRARSRSCCARRAASCAWQNGVLITETQHGFVCANGGVDASNVGPGLGRPRHAAPPRPGRVRRPDPRRAPRAASAPTSPSSCPTASAARGAGASWTSRSACPGLLPLDDLRGQPDADGRVMRTTVRAVADEIASRRRARPGQDRRPARGAGPRRARRTSGEGRIAELLDARRERPVPLSATRATLAP